MYKIKNFKNRSNNVFTLFYVSIAAYFIGSINFKNAFWNWHDLQRYSQGLLILVIFGVFVQCAYITRPYGFSILGTIPRFIKIAFACFSTLGLLSCVFAAHIQWALLEWSSFLLLILTSAFIATIRVFAGTEFDKKLISIMVVTCLVYLIGCIARYATVFSGINLNVWTLFDGFVNIRFFGHLQTMSLPLLVLPVFLAKSKLLRRVFVVLLGCWWMLAIASGTRGTWLGVAIAIMCVWFLNRPLCRVWVRWQMYGLITGLFLYFLLFFTVPMLFQSGVQTVDRLPNLFGLSAREILWSAAIKMIEGHPILGVGPMHFGTDSLTAGAHPHNAILQLAAEWGIPAMLLFLSMAMFGMYRLIIGINGARDLEEPSLAMTRIALFACLIGAATQSMVDGVIVMPYSQTLLIVMTGWAMGICLSEKPMSPAVSLPLAGNSLVIVLAVVLGTVTISIVSPLVLKLDEKEQAYILKKGGLFSPRFWLQGLIHPKYWGD